MTETDKRVLAEKAKRIEEDLGMFLDQMEREAFEMALGCDRATADGQDHQNDYLRVVTVIRGLRDKLKVAILEANQQQRSSSARMVA
jgi:hypothetical protein